MKTIILAGGFGTRLSKYTENTPKPMVEIGGYPMLWHIMNIYSYYGYNDFIIATGYLSNVIKRYFISYKPASWKVTLVDTGLDTMTGGRVRRLRDYVENETFMLTYGDGVANININKLVAFHKSHGKMATITAVHPPARFGELIITESNDVIFFKEKPQVTYGWINGGFFVLEPEFFDLIDDDLTVLEEEPLECAAEIGELKAYIHNGFWQCMDTIRDRDVLEKLWNDNQAPWRVWK